MALGLLSRRHPCVQLRQISFEGVSLCGMFESMLLVYCFLHKSAG